MPGTQLSRRHFSVRARQGRKRLQRGSKQALVTCCKDFFNIKLIPIKIAFFFIIGATQCIAPFSTLLMKELGFTFLETAIIFTMGSLIPLIAPCLVNIMMAKPGICRRFLVISALLSGVFSLLYVVIPVARTKIPLPEKNIKFDLTCKNNRFNINYTEPDECISPSKTISLDRINVSDCGFLCDRSVLNMRRAEEVNVYIPHNESFVFICKIGIHAKQKCIVNDKRTNELVSTPTKFALYNVDLNYSKNQLNNKKVRLKLKINVVTSSEGKVYDCKRGKNIEKTMIRKQIVSHLADGLSPQGEPQNISCNFHCTGEMESKLICNNTHHRISHDVPLSLGLFAASKMIGALTLGLTYSLFEVGVGAILREHEFDYGIQRIYGSLGAMIFAPVTGYLIDYFGSGDYSDYYLSYYLYFALRIACVLILIKLNMRFTEHGRNFCGNIVEIFTNSETFLLVIIVSISGMCYGFIETFLPWHIHDLGAENMIIGLMTSVAAISAMPFLAMSEFFCRRFGHIQCISFGIVCYSIRCFGYSLLKNPYWCFPFEVLEGVTTGLLVAAAIIYGAKLSHEYGLVTFQGILATSHYGLGKSMGSLLGGFLMSEFGNKIAFRIFGGGSFVIAFIYYVIFKLTIQSKQEQHDKARREVSTMQVQVIPRQSLEEGFAQTHLNNSPGIKFPKYILAFNEHNKEKYKVTP